MWISDQRHQQSLQQLSQQQQHGGDENHETENVYVIEEAEAESKPDDIVYAQIEANNQGHRPNVPSPNMIYDDNAVIYSDLEGGGSGTHTNDLYANLSR